MVFGSSRSAQGVNPFIPERNCLPLARGRIFRSILPFHHGMMLTWMPLSRSSNAALKQMKSLTSWFVDPWMLDGLTGGGETTWLNADWADVCDMNPIRFAWHKTNPLDVMVMAPGWICSGQSQHCPVN